MRAKLLMFIVLSFTAHLLDGQAQQTLSTRVGDVAAGKIESEEKGTLLLNVRPCEQTARFLQFRAPYIKREQTDAQCPGGAAYKRFVVEQK